MYILEIKQILATLPDTPTITKTVNQQYFLDYERPKAMHIGAELEEHFKRAGEPYTVELIRVSGGESNG